MMAFSSVLTLLVVGSICMIVLLLIGALVASVIVRRQNKSNPPRNIDKEG